MHLEGAFSDDVHTHATIVRNAKYPPRADTTAFGARDRRPEISCLTDARHPAEPATRPRDDTETPPAFRVEEMMFATRASSHFVRAGS